MNKKKKKCISYFFRRIRYSYIPYTYKQKSFFIQEMDNDINSFSAFHSCLAPPELPVPGSILVPGTDAKRIIFFSIFNQHMKKGTVPVQNIPLLEALSVQR